MRVEMIGERPPRREVLLAAVTLINHLLAQASTAQIGHSRPHGSSQGGWWARRDRVGLPQRVEGLEAVGDLQDGEAGAGQ